MGNSGRAPLDSKSPISSDALSALTCSLPAQLLKANIRCAPSVQDPPSEFKVDKSSDNWAKCREGRQGAVNRWLWVRESWSRKCRVLKTQAHEMLAGSANALGPLCVFRVPQRQSRKYIVKENRCNRPNPSATGAIAETAQFWRNKRTPAQSARSAHSQPLSPQALKSQESNAMTP